MRSLSLVRRFLPILGVAGLVLAALPGRAAGEGGWTTAGVFTNPAINTILADTGGITRDATLSAQALISCEVTCIVAIEYRDATDTSNVWTHIVILPSADTRGVYDLHSFLSVTGQRVRLRLVQAITGRAQGSIFFDF